MYQPKLFARIFDAATLITAISIFSFSATQIVGPNQLVEFTIIIQPNRIQILATTNANQRRQACNEAF